MGANGSSTLKVDIIPQLFHFTQYGKPELTAFWKRGMVDLSETFALRLSEFSRRRPVVSCKSTWSTSSSSTRK